MKPLVIILNVVLIIILGVKVFDLIKNLDAYPESGRLFDQSEVGRILRPKAIKEFDLRKIFDTKEPIVVAKKDPDQKKAAKELNQVVDKNIVLRLRGIVKAKDVFFVVMDVEIENKKEKTIRLFQGEGIRDYIVEKIFENHVELSKGNEQFILKIFKPTQG